LWANIEEESINEQTNNEEIATNRSKLKRKLGKHGPTEKE
jgi:hypothetical protein